jgi:hypothetical protein
MACGGGLGRPAACVAAVAAGASGGGRSAHPVVCVAAVAGSGAPGACMAAATWWRWCRRSGRGGPVLCGGPARGWAHIVLFAFFNPFQKSLPRAVYASRHRCAERICWGSRHRALCRPDGAECPVPRASSRQSLCREETILYREHAALGKGCESGSERHAPPHGTPPPTPVALCKTHTLETLI